MAFDYMGGGGGGVGGGGGMAGFNPQNMQSFLGGASNPYDEEWMRRMMGGQGGPGSGMRGGMGGPQQPYGRPGQPLPGGGIPQGGYSALPYGGPQNAGLSPPGGGGGGGMGGGGTPYKPPKKPGYPPVPNNPPTVGVNTGNWGGVAGPGGLYKSGGTGGWGPGSWFPGR